jgi:hypothetical protein
MIFAEHTGRLQSRANSKWEPKCYQERSFNMNNSSSNARSTNNNENRQAQPNGRQMRELIRAISNTSEKLSELQEALSQAEGDRRLLRNIRDAERDLNRLQRDLRSLAGQTDEIQGVRELAEASRRLRGIDLAGNQRQAELAIREFARVFRTLGSMLSELPSPLNRCARSMESQAKLFVKLRRDIGQMLANSQGPTEQGDDGPGRRSGRSRDAA